jgi:hypothetical protein
VSDFRPNLEGVLIWSQPSLGVTLFDGEESSTLRMKRDGLLRNSVFGEAGLSISTILQYFGISMGIMMSIDILWMNA